MSSKIRKFFQAALKDWEESLEYAIKEKEINTINSVYNIFIYCSSRFTHSGICKYSSVPFDVPNSIDCILLNSKERSNVFYILDKYTDYCSAFICKPIGSCLSVEECIESLKKRISVIKDILSKTNL